MDIFGLYRMRKENIEAILAFAVENNYEFILTSCEEVIVDNFEDLPSVVSSLSKDMFQVKIL